MDLYLDAGPMIRALSETPSAFDTDGYVVCHRPSRHWLSFDEEGNARIAARCSCAELPVSREQSTQPWAAVAVWQEIYWRPLIARKAAERRIAEINRAFAQHFRPRSPLRRALDAILSFCGLKDRLTPAFPDPTMPKDAELRARPLPAAREDERDELLSE
jgi:hypothetical protein